MKTVNRSYLAALVNRAKRNDSDAFAELYVLTYKEQYMFAKRYLRDADYAQDAIQEVYILALKNITTLKEPKVFTSWLRQINLRVCYDFASKRKATINSGEDELEFIADNNVSVNPEASLLESLGSEELKNALLKIPVKERNAIMMKYSGEMQLSDIAGAMECSISSVTRYLSRGYAHLKVILQKGEQQL